MWRDRWAAEPRDRPGGFRTIGCLARDFKVGIPCQDELNLVRKRRTIEVRRRLCGRWDDEMVAKGKANEAACDRGANMVEDDGKGERMGVG